MFNFVSSHSDFVASNHGIKTIGIAKGFRDVRTELQPHATFTGTATRVGLWVCPEHFVYEAFAGRLTSGMSVNLTDVVQGDAIFGEESAVQDEVFVPYQCCER